MQKSARKRKRLESVVDVALEKQRASGGNRKPLEKQPVSAPQRKKGATLARLSEVWSTFKP